MKRWVRLAINITGFNSTWLAGLILAGKGLGWAGLAVVMANVIAQALLAPRRAREAAFYAVAALGAAADVGLVLGGLIRYRGESGVSAEFVALFAALWASFATTVTCSLGTVLDRLWLGVVLGAFGGPLSYFGGSKLGAITLGERPWLTLGVVAVQYAVLTPLLMWLARRFVNEAASPGVLR